jgi:hypothetical protein
MSTFNSQPLVYATNEEVPFKRQWGLLPDGRRGPDKGSDTVNDYCIWLQERGVPFELRIDTSLSIYLVKSKLHIEEPEYVEPVKEVTEPKRGGIKRRSSLR